MYAQYDNIIFEPINSFDGITDDEEALWPEHSIISGKPKLQPTGLNAREMTIGIRLRQEFGDISTVHNRLRTLLREQKVSTLIWGNGNIEGNFVLLRLSRAIEEQDERGNIYAISLTLNLKEYEITNALDVQKKNAVKNAGAFSSNATPVVTPKVNPQTTKQKLVKNLTAARRYLNIIRSTSAAATSAYNGSITDKIMFMSSSLSAVKEISALTGPATEYSKSFDSNVADAQTALTSLAGYVPVTTGNINDFNSALGVLAGKMDQVNVMGSIFTKQVVTGRSTQYIVQ